MAILLQEIYSEFLDESRKFININKFKKLTWPEQKAFLYTIEKLGEGSARTVFLVDSKRVLKVAKNKKGIAQNKAEVEVYKNPHTKDIVTKIFDYDKDYKWIISELVRPLNGAEFYKIMGFHLGDFITELEDFLNSGNSNNLKSWPHSDHPIVLGLIRAVKHANIDLADLVYPGHWGKTPDGNIVILDYGYTGFVRDKYYSNFENSGNKEI